jgi:hypothetical protein
VYYLRFQIVRHKNMIPPLRQMEYLTLNTNKIFIDSFKIGSTKSPTFVEVFKLQHNSIICEPYAVNAN